MDAFITYLNSLPDPLIYLALGVSAFVENVFPPIPGDTITAFGAFLEIIPGTDGLLHISEIDYNRTERVEDFCRVGDMVKVQVIEIDPEGKVRLSRKALLPRPEGYEPRPSGPRRDGPRRNGPPRRGGPRGGDDRRRRPASR